MLVKFWGVRGSFPVPGAQTNRFGGNTACVQICPTTGERIVIDAGTGIRSLGKELLSARGEVADSTIHLLISHTHWDHIQGIPFFAPLYQQGGRVHIYARQRDVHLQTIFSSQTEDPYFPVSLDDVAANVTYTELMEGQAFEIGHVRVRCARLNHPFIALGYRLEADGCSVAYVSDTAPYDRMLYGHRYIPDSEARELGPATAADQRALCEMKAQVIELCRDCDLIIYDTMFRMDEYLARQHWGHSSPEHAIEIAEQAGARAVALYHLAPGRSDDEVEADLRSAQRLTDLQVVAAAEGLSVDLARIRSGRRGHD